MPSVKMVGNMTELKRPTAMTLHMAREPLVATVRHTRANAASAAKPRTLAGDINLILRRSECLGIIGPNGSGKTTFLKTILGKIPPLAGEFRWGSKVEIGYYAQQLEDLDDRNEIIMELRRVAPASATSGELRSFLAKFHFFGDDIY